MTRTPKTSQQDQALALTMPSHVDLVESASLIESSHSGTASSSVITGTRTKRDRRRFLQAATAFGAVGYSEIFGPLSSGLAEDRTKLTKVVSVDSAARSISFSEGELRVLQTVTVYVNGKRGNFEDIRPGHDVIKLVRNPQNFVSRIEVSGNPDEAEVAGLPRGQKQPSSREGALLELPKAYVQKSPCVHFGGRQFFWSSTSSSNSAAVVYVAERDTVEEPFRNPKSLFTAKEFSISSSRMLVVFFDGDALYGIGRITPDAPFLRPRAITTVKKDGLLSSPRLSGDATRLYCDRQVERGFEQVVLTRNSVHEEWGPPQEVEIPADFRGSLRSISPIVGPGASNTGYAVACLHNQEKPGPSVFILREGDRPNSFVSCKPIKVDGAFVTGFSPDYCHRTGELFLMGIGPGKGDAVGFLFKVKVPNLLG